MINLIGQFFSMIVIPFKTNYTSFNPSDIPFYWISRKIYSILQISDKKQKVYLIFSIKEHSFHLEPGKKIGIPQDLYYNYNESSSINFLTPFNKSYKTFKNGSYITEDFYLFSDLDLKQTKKYEKIKLLLK